jgi:hypothetical protein
MTKQKSIVEWPNQNSAFYLLSDTFSILEGHHCSRMKIFSLSCNTNTGREIEPVKNIQLYIYKLGPCFATNIRKACKGRGYLGYPSCRS